MAVTLALATTAFCESCRVPEIEPVVIPWPDVKMVVAKTNRAVRQNNLTNARLIDIEHALLNFF